MACFDELVDDIDKDLLNEIQKNEEIMKALGPLHPNLLNDFNNQAQDDLLEEDSKPLISCQRSPVLQPKSRISSRETNFNAESPPGFSITQALKLEEQCKAKFVYPHQLRSMHNRPNELCFNKKSPTFAKKLNSKKFAVTVPLPSDKMLRGITTSEVMADLPTTPTGDRLKPDSKDNKVTKVPSTPCNGPTPVDGGPSPILRKRRSAVRKRKKYDKSTVLKEKEEILSSADMPSCQATASVKISLAQKRPITYQAEEFNPWKKNSFLSCQTRAISSSSKKSNTNNNASPFISINQKSECSSVNPLLQSNCKTVATVPRIEKNVVQATKPPSVSLVASASLSKAVKKITFEVTKENKTNKLSNSVTDKTQTNTLKQLEIQPQCGANESSVYLGNNFSHSNNSQLRNSIGNNIALSVPSGALNYNGMPSSTGFQTASKKPLTVSDASWKKARNIIANIDAPINIKPSTAGKAITVSKDGWNKASNLIKKDPITGPTTPSCHEINSSNSAVALKPFTNPIHRLNHAKMDKSSPGITTGFKTANSRPLTVSKDSWNRAQKIFDNETSGLHNENANNQTSGFTTASKKPLSVSTESLEKAKNLIETDGESAKFSGFGTARVKSLNVSKQSWAKVQHIFKDDNVNSDISESKNKTSLEEKVSLTVNNPRNFILTPGADIIKHSVLTPVSRTLPSNTGVCSERRSTRPLSSCPNAKRRNSSYKPPRRKILLGESAKNVTVNRNSLDLTNDKENVELFVESSRNSVKRKLGMKQTQEEQIHVSDESLLMAMELFENI